MTDYSARDLLAMGCRQGPDIPKVLAIVNARPHTADEVEAVIRAHAPPPALPMLDEPAPCRWNIDARDELEAANVAAVRETMDAVLRTPVAVAGAVMPDACPAGPVGTIPVGGVVGLRNAISPGMHSADICCSLMLTEFERSAPADVLDAAHRATHFGPGGRPRDAEMAMPEDLMDAIAALPYRDANLLPVARSHLGTQGDGNHFLYVGRSESTGRTVMVTHHGSRGFGARLYKAGARIAERWRAVLSPETAKPNAWIPLDSDEGRAYWDALQIVRAWTKRNHESIHEATIAAVGGDVTDRFWNEHNFVFREESEDGPIVWHAKGATPVHDAFLPDTDGRQIVPLNMAEPVLIVRGERSVANLGFAPHGAGRNMSRTRHKKALGGRSEADVVAAETEGLDVRFWCGNPDVSELPSAYKNADSVQADMRAFGLADVVDRVLPHGSVMAGDWERDAPWKNKRRRGRR